MTGVPYPPNPPENPHLAMDDEFDHAADALTWQEGFAAADSWWRSRLVSDEAVEAVAQVLFDQWCGRWGYPLGIWSESPDANQWATDARAAISAARALLPVNEPETDT